MNHLSLVWRNFTAHRAANSAVILGMAIATAALTGALVVGDSVRGTLREQALNRVAHASWAMTASEGFFRQDLRAIHTSAVPILSLRGTARHSSGKAFAGRVQVFGVTHDFPAGIANSCAIAPGKALLMLNAALAKQLGARAGDEIVLRVEKPLLFARDAALSPREDSTFGWRLQVGGILPPDHGGDLNLQGSGAETFNAFVPIEALGVQAELGGMANVLLITSNSAGGVANLAALIRKNWNLQDVGLSITNAGHGWELRSSRVFIAPEIVQTIRHLETSAVPVLTYLANLLEHEGQATPYSMVTAAGPPYTPPEMTDDEILVSRWLADDLALKEGSQLKMSYFMPETASALHQATNIFRVRAVLPEAGIHADPTLMPDFPGIEEAETTHDWKAGFPLEYKIRDKDEEYWGTYRGTPKAFLTASVGQKLWSNRFGVATGIRLRGVRSGADAARLSKALLETLEPQSTGFNITPVRSQALASAEQSQDFGQLFLAFSIFIVFAALLLVGLLFQFSLESRLAEAGILGALGFAPRRVRLLFSGEALLLALLGALVGLPLGLLYAKGLLWALSTMWSDAVGGLSLHLFITGPTLGVSALSAIVVSALAAGLGLWRFGRRALQELLTTGAAEPETSPRTAGFMRAASIALFLAAVAISIWSAVSHETSPGAFFSAGTLLLLAQWALLASLLRKSTRRREFNFAGFAILAMARRPKRSLSVVALLSAGCFVIIAIGAFHLQTANLKSRNSGSGGFDLIASSAVPLLHDLRNTQGRTKAGLEEVPPAVQIVSFRVMEGDEASCLNLNRAAKPRLLGVRPESLDSRFTFVHAAKDWRLLHRKRQSGELRVIPAIGDANSIRWSMGKQVGDTIDFTDERGRPFRVRIVGAIQNSILQGSLVIDENAFTQLYPGSSGWRYFLVDTAGTPPGKVSETLSRNLEDFGMEVLPASARLAALNGVQNTYLSTFQILGGLGLLLGSIGLGVLVLRNVMERRGELAVLAASGFTRARLVRLVAVEHGILLIAGFLCGLIAAVVAVAPAIAGRETAWTAVMLIVVLVLCNGAAWTWTATRVALRGKLIEALRNE